MTGNLKRESDSTLKVWKKGLYLTVLIHTCMFVSQWVAFSFMGNHFLPWWFTAWTSSFLYFWEEITSMPVTLYCDRFAGYSLFSATIGLTLVPFCGQIFIWTSSRLDFCNINKTYIHVYLFFSPSPLWIMANDLLIKIYIPNSFHKHYALQTNSYEIQISATYDSAFQKN